MTLNSEEDAWKGAYLCSPYWLRKYSEKHRQAYMQCFFGELAITM